MPCVLEFGQASLLEKYAPQTLDDIRGQPHVTGPLKRWLANPRSTAVILAGETGLGKSATAEVLARSLGCDDLCGLYVISSGEMGKADVQHAVDQLHHSVLFGDGRGWRVLIAEEADAMSKAAEEAWLTPLDLINKRGEPHRALIVFTTNHPAKLSDRLRDRCAAHFYLFESRPAKLRPAISEFCQEIWRSECGPDDPFPFGPNLGMRSLSGAAADHCSFRLALAQLDRAIQEREAVCA